MHVEQHFEGKIETHDPFPHPKKVHFIIKSISDSIEDKMLITVVLFFAETKARVVDKFDEGGDDDDDDLPASGLRKRTAALLADSDKRYRGRVTSRKELEQELDGSGV